MKKRSYSLKNLMQPWMAAKSAQFFGKTLKKQKHSGRYSDSYLLQKVNKRTKLYLSVSDTCVSVWLWHREWFDILFDLDFFVHYKEGRGYYCGLCKEEERVYSEDAGWFFSEHCEITKHLETWLTEKWKPRQYLVLTRLGGMRDARIITREDKNIGKQMSHKYRVFRL